MKSMTIGFYFWVGAFIYTGSKAFLVPAALFLILHLVDMYEEANQVRQVSRTFNGAFKKALEDSKKEKEEKETK